MDTFGRNAAEFIRNTHIISTTDHGETSATSRGWEMGDAQGGSSAGSGRNAVVDDPHKETIVNRGAVGHFVTDI